MPGTKVRVVKSDLVRSVGKNCGPLQFFHLVVREGGRDCHLTVADIRSNGEGENRSDCDETARNDGCRDQCFD